MRSRQLARAVRVVPLELPAHESISLRREERPSDGLHSLGSTSQPLAPDTNRAEGF